MAQNTEAPRRAAGQKPPRLERIVFRFSRLLDFVGALATIRVSDRP